MTFRGNGGAGSVAFVSGSTGVVEDALFEQSRGQSAFIKASDPVFHRTTFRDNVLPTNGAGTEGAGALIDGGSPRFEDCLFENLRTNFTLSGAGGAVLVRLFAGPAHPVFIRTTFRNNTANQGGGVRIQGDSALFLFCHFERNTAYSGGGLYIDRTAVTVIGSTFVGNHAETGATAGYGGAIKYNFPPQSGTSLVASTLFAGNTARNGGAVDVGFPVDFVNATFAGNTASERGGAAYLFDAGGVRFRNVVLWGDAAPTGPEVHVRSGTGTVERAIIQGGCPAGTTCTDALDADPLFLREPDPGADGTWGTADDDYGDLRVQPGSPALDAGLTALLPADVWDLDGDGDTAEPLPVDLSGTRRVWGPEVDLGAYERGPTRRSPTRPRAAVVSEEPAAVQVSVHPNPMRGTGTVAVTLPDAGTVSVAVYDALGRRVIEAAPMRLGAGSHVLPLDVGGLPPGVYLARVTVGGAAPVTRRLVVAR